MAVLVAQFLPNDSSPASTSGGSQATPAPEDGNDETGSDASANGDAVATEDPAATEPAESDLRAVAIEAVQTETESYRGESDDLVRDVLELTCAGLMSYDGETVGDFGFEMGETALESAGFRRSEYPVVMRAATAFCPKALPEVAERYGS